MNAFIGELWSLLLVREVRAGHGVEVEGGDAADFGRVELEAAPGRSA